VALITSQLPDDQWHTYLGDPTLAGAILDWLVHNEQYPSPLNWLAPDRWTDITQTRGTTSIDLA
jgi:hypothetical protein